MASVTRLIQKEIYDKLVEKIPTFFEDTLELEVPRIKMGNLQDDPESVSASFMVHIQDPDNSTILDFPVKGRANELVPNADTSAMYGSASNQLYSVGRIGGGRTWAKFFTVEIIQFTPGLTQDESADLCMEVVDFTCDTLKTVSISDITDGSRTGVSIKLDSVRTEEGGGPPSDYHWVTYIKLIAEVLDKNG
jgi:hypothetical protein